ncbi:MAG: hypothetical protein EA408_04550 [Marinilabiliales bacterium]|nr:MAG: hypothetical protein EA408_04550 [Marinilabiliales bacterium]
MFLACFFSFGSPGSGVAGNIGKAGPDEMLPGTEGFVTPGTPGSAIDGMPLLAPSDLPGAVISRSEIFVGGALWGLINGAADLYYEYGFDRMALQEIGWEGENFRLELYRMDNPVAAYGIFSVSVHGCEEGGPASTGYCINRFQYQMYSGGYYLSLINYSGSDRARELSLRAAEVLADRIGGMADVDSGSGASVPGMPGPVIPGVLSSSHFKGLEDGIRLVKGIIGVQSLVPGLAHLFEGMDDFQLWNLGFTGEDGKYDILLVRFSGVDPLPEAAMIKEGLSMAGYAARESGGKVVAVMSSDPSGSLDLLDLIFPSD